MVRLTASAAARAAVPFTPGMTATASAIRLPVSSTMRVPGGTCTIQVSASLGSAESRVPPLARTLTGRLSRSLSTGAAAALAAIGAAGRIGVAEALEVLNDLADPADALDAAALAGVVVETGDRLAAAHPLIGAAAVELLPPARRAQLYRRLAEVSSSPERYAHFTALAAGPGPDAAVAEALDAAPLKNALDFLYYEWHGKPATSVTYGTRGGSKGADQIHQVFEGLHMRPLETRLEVVITDDQVDHDWQMTDLAATMRPYANLIRQLDAEMIEALEDTQ